MQSSELGRSPGGKPVLDRVESPTDGVVLAGFVSSDILEELSYKRITRFLVIHQRCHGSMTTRSLDRVNPQCVRRGLAGRFATSSIKGEQPTRS